MRLTILASGSSGNSLLVEGAGTSLLVDAGLARRTLARRMQAAGLSRQPEELDGVLLSHEHGDHVKCAATLGKAGVPLYATAGTARAAELEVAATLTDGVPQIIGSLQVTPVALPHDAAEPVGFLIDDGSARLGVLTDCGHRAPWLQEAFSGCDVLMLETNHDPALLQGGPYPLFLKRRIAGTRGHLANRQAADLLSSLDSGRLQTLVLGHLSRTNNEPQLAYAAISEALGRVRCRAEVHVAEQSRPLPPISCKPRRRPEPVVHAAAAQQLQLPFL